MRRLNFTSQTQKEEGRHAKPDSESDKPSTKGRGRKGKINVADSCFRQIVNYEVGSLQKKIPPPLPRRFYVKLNLTSVHNSGTRSSRGQTDSVCGVVSLQRGSVVQRPSGKRVPPPSRFFHFYFLNINIKN